jgi:trans-aconitate 2-methyltransferase
MPIDWDAETYHRVSEPQVAWGERVLAGLALRGDERIVDLGCGSGRLTARLADRVPAGTLVALDRSSQMLSRAREHFAGGPCRRLHVVRADLPCIPIHRWADLVFSTATFHWVRDHATLFANVFDSLRPGGRLVAQCGGAGNLQRFHRLALDLAFSPGFRHWFATWTEPWEFSDPATASARLSAAGFTDIEASLQEAPTPFGDAVSFAAFVRAVVLRPMLAMLPDAERRERFVATVVQAAARAPEPLVLDYRRLDLAARRPAEGDRSDLSIDVRV